MTTDEKLDQLLKAIEDVATLVIALAKRQEDVHKSISQNFLGWTRICPDGETMDPRPWERNNKAE